MRVTNWVKDTDAQVAVPESAVTWGREGLLTNDLAVRIAQCSTHVKSGGDLRVPRPEAEQAEQALLPAREVWTGSPRDRA